MSRCIIATGGSVIYRASTMENFKKMGVIVYLRHSYEVIASRLWDMEKRGVVMKGGNTLKDLFDERTPLYEKYADIIVDLGVCTVDEATNKLAEALGK